MKKSKALVPVLIFILFSCGSKNSVNSQSQTSKKERLYNLWMLKVINHKQANKTIHLEINTSKNNFSGTDGCNNIFGALKKLTENEIVFGEVMATKMMCDDMVFPTKYLNALSQVRYYKIEKKRLYLLNTHKNSVLEYVKTN